MAKQTTKRTTKKATTRPRAAATRATKVKAQGVTPFLWFEKGAEEAARFYVSLLQGSKLVHADPMSVEFDLGGQRFLALNGGPAFKPTPAFSIFVLVRTQEEVDALWTALTVDGGKESMCGWLEDRYGVSWQIIPERLLKLIRHKDRAKAERATQAMLKMQKIDIATLEQAAKGK